MSHIKSFVKLLLLGPGHGNKKVCRAVAQSMLLLSLGLFVRREWQQWRPPHGSAGDVWLLLEWYPIYGPNSSFGYGHKKR